MSHVDDGTLHALVDDALDVQERIAVEAHLAACGDCARRFAEATAMARQVVSLLGALDEDAGAVRIVKPTVNVPLNVPLNAPLNMPVNPSAAAAKMSAAVGNATVIPIRSRMRTLRRVALAASVLVVAGVSYQVGRTRDAVPSADRAASVALVAPAARKVATPSSVTALADSYGAMPEAPPPPRFSGGPRNEAEVTSADRSDAASGSATGSATGAATGGAAAPAATSAKSVAPGAAPYAAPAPVSAAPRAISMSLPNVAVAESARDSAAERRAEADTRSREANDALTRVQTQEQVRATQASPPAQAPTRRMRRGPTDQLDQVVVTGVAGAARQPSPAAGSASAVADNGAPAKPAASKPVIIAGYTALEDESLPSLTRRRYVSPNGASIVLLIMKPPTEQKAAATQDAESAFVVFSTNGQSTVRWRAHGRHYELQGALGPDSLVKIATLFK